VDRYKEYLKVQGVQVSPTELETILLSHPLVLEAAVVPRPDLEFGVVPRAYVRLDKSDADSINEAQLREFVDTQVAPLKQLRGGVVIVDEFPRSTIGKIDRKALRSMAAS